MQIKSKYLFLVVFFSQQYQNHGEEDHHYKQKCCLNSDCQINEQAVGIFQAMHLILNITTQSMDYLDALLKLPTQKRTNPLSLLSFSQTKTNRVRNDS